MIKLNFFQKKCKEKLIKELNSIGIRTPIFKIKESEGKWFAGEVFIETSVDGLNLWIYEDGAHIQNGNDDIPFESPDYKSEDDLIRAFTKKVIELLKNSLNETAKGRRKCLINELH